MMKMLMMKTKSEDLFVVVFKLSMRSWMMSFWLNKVFFKCCCCCSAAADCRFAGNGNNGRLQTSFDDHHHCQDVFVLLFVDLALHGELIEAFCCCWYCELQEETREWREEEKEEEEKHQQSVGCSFCVIFWILQPLHSRVYRWKFSILLTVCMIVSAPISAGTCKTFLFGRKTWLTSLSSLRRVQSQAFRPGFSSRSPLPICLYIPASLEEDSATLRATSGCVRWQIRHHRPH